VLVGDAPAVLSAGCWLFEVKRPARSATMRVTTAFSRLLQLTGVWVRKVRFESDRVIVEVVLRGRGAQGHAAGGLGLAASGSRGLAA